MYTQHEVILDYMELSENEGQKGYPVLKKACKMAWYKLFKNTKESIVRKWVAVDDDGTIKFPPTFENLLGLFVVDSCGDLAPLYEDNVKSILIKPENKCGCKTCRENDCLCPTIQDVTSQVDIVINGVPYTNITVTRVVNGTIVEETSSHVASFLPNGAFKEAVPVTTQTIKCNLELKSCGCPVKNEENTRKLLGCGCIIDCYAPYERNNYPALYNTFGYYKVEDENKKIHIFDHHGKKTRISHIQVVGQSNGFDILVPDYAHAALMALLDFFKKMYSPSYNEGQVDAARRHYNRLEFEMIKYLNPIPFEWFVQVGDATKKYKNMPYYTKIHSDFVKPEIVYVCQTPAPNITNIINSDGSKAGMGKFKKIVGTGDGPTTGINTYQHADLAGLGDQSENQIDIRIAKTDMYNYGPNPDFTFSGTTITLLNGLTWQEDDVLSIDLNQ